MSRSGSLRLDAQQGPHADRSFSTSLPLPDATPEVFRMLPEFLIEDITEFISFTSKYVPSGNVRI